MGDAALPKQAILIVNARSRRGADFEQARDLLTASGVELIEAFEVRDPAALDALVKRAIAEAPMVIVGGGDGTLSSAVDFFLGIPTVFAILPLGTANNFARTLGVPLDLEGAIGVIANGVRKRVDLGRVDGDYFANAATIGLSPLIAESVPRRLKKLLGRLGYLIWAVRVAFKFRPFRLTVDDGKQRCTLWAAEVRIANGRYQGGVELVEDASLDSGVIIVQAVTGKSIARLAWNWFTTLFGLPGRAQTVTEFRGRELKLEARPRQKIAIDGEIAARTPVTVGVARGAVWVAAPGE